MPFYFSNHPTISYDINKDGNPKTVHNILVRYKIQSILQSRTAVYYEYDIKEGERADTIADKYYGDSTLSWIIYLTNQTLDPNFDWPLGYSSFVNHVNDSYGSLAIAQTTIHHYEQIITQSTKIAGKLIKERTLEVDETTYNSLLPVNRRIVYAYEYESNVNDARRSIKILDEKYVASILTATEDIFN